MLQYAIAADRNLTNSDQLPASEKSKFASIYN